MKGIMAAFAPLRGCTYYWSYYENIPLSSLLSSTLLQALYPPFLPRKPSPVDLAI
jgi:hypothetical protein